MFLISTTVKKSPYRYGPITRNEFNYNMKNVKPLMENFTKIDNRIVRLPNLSFGAKGLYCYMASMSHEWKFSLNQISKDCGVKLVHVTKYLNELFEVGLVTREVDYTQTRGRKYSYIINGYECLKGSNHVFSNIETSNIETSNLETSNIENSNIENSKLETSKLEIANTIEDNINKKKIIKEENSFKEDKARAREKAPATFKAPTVEEAIAYFIANGYTEDSARRFFSYYDCAGWKDSNGKSVRNWKQKAQAVWFKDENKISKPIYNRPNNQDACYESVEERVARFMRETGQVSTNEDKTQNNATVEPSGGYLDYLNMASDWEPNQK